MTSGSTPGGRRFGAYLLEEELGRGGMGVVYRARHATTGERVALKVILDAALLEETVRERFEREARAIARLDHPGVVALREVGAVEGRAFLALELVDGEPLGHLLRRGALGLERALEVGHQVARAIAHAHEHGVIHRDLKPSNVLVVRQEGDGPVRAKVVDFGLARSASDARLTATGTLVGTPAWLSPEQARSDGSPVGPAADVHALGALLYRMVAGRDPFQGDEVTVLKKILLDRPASPRTLDPTVPAALDALILRCLEKDPGVRPQAAEVARLLAEIGVLGRKGTLARRSRVVPVAAGAAAVLLAAALVVASIGPGAKPPPPPARPPAQPAPAPRPVPPPVQPPEPPPPPARPPQPKRAEDPEQDAIQAAMDCAERGDGRGALSGIEAVLERNPDHGHALGIRGQFFYELGRIDESERDLRRAIELTDSHDYHYGLANLLRGRGLTAEAIRSVERALEISPREAPFHALRGELALDGRDMALAKAESATALELRPHGPAVQLLRAGVLLAEDKPEEAIQVLDGIRNPGAAPNVHARRARALLALGRLDEALRDADMAVQIQPTVSVFHDVRARILEAKGDLRGALDASEKAAKLPPSSEEIVRRRDRLRALVR